MQRIAASEVANRTFPVRGIGRESVSPAVGITLQIRATNGTFGELVAAAGNLQSTAWWSPPKMAEGYYDAMLPTPKFVSDGSLLTLDDLLSRDHRFLGLYERNTGGGSRVHLAEIIADASGGIDVGVYATCRLSQADVQSFFGWPVGTAVNFRQAGQRLPLPNFHVHLTGTDLNALKPLLPATQFKGNDGLFVLEDLPNGDRLSEFLRTFILSYFLGILVRYYPSRWMALLRNEKGDMAQPLLMAAINSIFADFPELVVQALQ